MNSWTKKSFEIAEKGDYLDQLNTIYPSTTNSVRNLSKTDIEIIEKLYNSKEDLKLLLKLLDMPSFPINNSYVAYFRKDRKSLTNNPKTIKLIIEQIYKIPINELIKQCAKPIAPSRQMGSLFKNWITTRKFGVMFKDEKTFLNSKENGFLVASDDKLKRFAEKNFGYNLDKGLDLIARFNNVYVIGEAKFLTDIGGTQNNQFFSAVNLATKAYNYKDKKVISIAVIDGVCFIKNSTKIYNYLESSNDTILSALLLEQFLTSLQ
jgi:asparagine N-glycosylation enzyme membrane subunit Stt3